MPECGILSHQDLRLRLRLSRPKCQQATLQDTPMPLLPQPLGPQRRGLTRAVVSSLRLETITTRGNHVTHIDVPYNGSDRSSASWWPIGSGALNLSI